MSQSPDAHHTEAAAFALGILSEAERHAFEDHLSGCSSCRAEVESHRATMNWVALAAPPCEPPAHVRGRVLEAVRARHPLDERAVFEQGAFHFVRIASLPPSAEPVPRLDIHTLSIDAERGYRTILVRMQPGARIPPHRHHGCEESFVLSGSLVVEGVTMRGGDYCRAEASSEHHEVYSPDGCTFVAVASMSDVFLAPAAS